MTIFLYKDLTRNPEIRNTPFRVFPNTWRLGQAKDTKFGMNVYIRVIAFSISESLRENQQVGVKLLSPHPPPLPPLLRSVLMFSDILAAGRTSFLI